MAYIHIKHFKDGYPLCWPAGSWGKFNATNIDSKVTCPACLKLMAIADMMEDGDEWQ